MLCEAGLLPGALRRNATLSFVCRQMELEVADDGTPWTSGRPERRRRSRSRSRTTRAPGTATPTRRGWCCATAEDLLGSTDRVAGIASADGNVMGLMPHPEEACDPLLGSTDGALVLSGLIA